MCICRELIMCQQCRRPRPTATRFLRDFMRDLLAKGEIRRTLQKIRGMKKLSICARDPITKEKHFRMFSILYGLNHHNKVNLISPRPPVGLLQSAEYECHLTLCQMPADRRGSFLIKCELSSMNGRIRREKLF